MTDRFARFGTEDSGQLKNTIGHFHRKDCRHV